MLDFVHGYRVIFFSMLMRVAGNSLGAEGGAAVGRSLTALTALQLLNLSGNAACFVMIFFGLFCMWLRVFGRGEYCCGLICDADARCRKLSWCGGRCCSGAIADGVDCAADAEAFQ